ncbi:hypothetical protein [Sphingomonas panacisoli]|uniref:hypothetical protein n=1 Tax=Sphingomonas panacisoli TaxID=1813879 RepID=UPI001647EEFD|nr:hypothetical protein [Sphingomonas panacisoli]
MKAERVHSDRIARALEKQAMIDDAVALAPRIAAVAKRHGYAPSTIARIAVARTASL